MFTLSQSEAALTMHCRLVTLQSKHSHLEIDEKLSQDLIPHRGESFARNAEEINDF